MDETSAHPIGGEGRHRIHDLVEKRSIGMLGGSRPRVVAGDDMIREAAQQGRIILRADVLE